MSDITELFEQHMHSAGIALRKPESVPRTEKTASVVSMQEAFAEKAGKAIMSRALADMWEDPIFSNLLNAGEVKTAASLAEGRFVDAATAEKIASLSAEEAWEMASGALEGKLQEKVASLGTDTPRRTSFPGIFGSRK